MKSLTMAALAAAVALGAAGCTEAPGIQARADCVAYWNARMRALPAIEQLRRSPLVLVQFREAIDARCGTIPDDQADAAAALAPPAPWAHLLAE